MRSKRLVFVAHCLLNQTLRQESEACKQLLQLLAASDVGIVQMPCPQLGFNGLDGRCQDRPGYRTYCKWLGKTIARQAEQYMAKGYKIVGIVGVEQSPNCAVRQLSNGKKTVWGSGLLIKELQAELGGKFRIPLVGANLSTIMSTLEQLHELLRAPQN